MPERAPSVRQRCQTVISASAPLFALNVLAPTTFSEVNVYFALQLQIQLKAISRQQFLVGLQLKRV